MTDMIIIVTLVLPIVLALLRSKKHFKGGGCSSNTIRTKKNLTEPKLAEKLW